MTKSKRGQLAAFFTGIATGAASGAIFGTSVNFISDLFGQSMSIPETLMNGFVFGVVPAVAMTGSAYVGAHILNAVSQNPETRHYATAHIAALLLGASLTLGYDIGSTDTPYVYNHGILYQPPSHPDFEPLLRALDFF